MACNRYPEIIVLLAFSLASGAYGAGPYQVTLAGDDSLNDGDSLAGLTNSGGSGTIASPYVYTFTTGGLNLDTGKVFTSAAGGKDSFTLNMGGHDLDGTGSTALSTYCSAVSGSQVALGNINIVNVGSVSVGTIDTRNTYAGIQTGGSGSVTIGSSSNPATGTVRVASFQTSASSSGSGGGQVTIYGARDVLIREAGGTNGDMVCRSDVASSVLVNHRGSFAARRIDTRDIAAFMGYDVGSVTLNGNWNNGVNAPAGSLVVTEYINSSSAINGHGGSVSISGYRQVEIAAIVSTVNWATSGAGDVSISGIAGSITIGGALDLRNFQTSDLNYWGKVTLQTAAGSRGVIYLGTNTSYTLDCSKFRYMVFRSDIGKTYISGAVSMPGATSTDKRNNVPTYLKGNTGQRVYYNHKLAANAWLGGSTYSLGTDTSGTGTLSPLPSPGFAITIR